MPTFQPGLNWLKGCTLAPGAGSSFANMRSCKLLERDLQHAMTNSSSQKGNESRSNVPLSLPPSRSRSRSRWVPLCSELNIDPPRGYGKGLTLETWEYDLIWKKSLQM